MISNDPIEKAPIHHYLPGSKTLSIATAGCMLRCSFCQNWQHSQVPPEATRNYKLMPKEVVREASSGGFKSITFTYTEPTVFYEYMLDIAELAKQNGISCIMASCGYINPKPLKELCQYLDAVVVGVKGFSEEFYNRICGGSLAPVLKTLEVIKSEGVWLEVAYLPVPALGSDELSTIRRFCSWIVSNLGDDVVLHILKFAPAYKFRNAPPTPISLLEQAYQVAKSCSIKYVYLGNIPGHHANNTYCASCGKLIVQRLGYKVLHNRVKNRKCPYCQQLIYGRL